MEKGKNYGGISENVDTAWCNAAKTGNEEENKTTVFRSQKNPLELSPVIKCVLQYMNVADLKNCRFNSKEWSSTALLELKIRSKIVFRKCIDDPVNGRLRDMNPAQFSEDFPNTSSSIPFTAFGFSGTERILEFNSFFERHKNVLHEVHINSLKLTDENGKYLLNPFDITHCISNSPMTMPNTKRSTKLSISQYKPGSSLIVVPMSTLIYVKKLVLEHCQVVVQDKIKVSPVELKLEGVKFAKNGHKLTNVCVNDVFDFSRCKKIQLLNYYDDGTFFHVDLSLTNSLALDCLSLLGCFINWRDCKWVVKKLKLFKMPIIETTELQVKEFHFHSSKIDLFVLPKSIETLVVNLDEENDCFCSQSLILPNLKSLCLDAQVHLTEIISHFVNCPLIELYLSDEEYFSQEINFDSIPKTVKKLKLKGLQVNLNEGRDRPLNLDKLVLESYLFSRCAHMLGVLNSSYFKTKELVFVNDCIGLKTLLTTRSQAIAFEQFLHSDKRCLDYNQRFYIGPFEGDLGSIFEKKMSKYVDREDRYYVFENLKGKVVDDEEFAKVSAVGPNKD